MFTGDQVMAGDPSSPAPAPASVTPWLFQVEPHSEESFGHFLGRFRRANGLSSAQLSAMLGQRSYTRLHWPTRLCPDCYAEAPWHRLTWQLNDQPECDVHQRRRSRRGETSLLAQCPRCHHAFPLPSHWATGQCAHCQLPFAQMRF